MIRLRSSHTDSVRSNWQLRQIPVASLDFAQEIFRSKLARANGLAVVLNKPCVSCIDVRKHPRPFVAATRWGNFGEHATDDPEHAATVYERIVRDQHGKCERKTLCSAPFHRWIKIATRKEFILRSLHHDVVATRTSQQAFEVVVIRERRTPNPFRIRCKISAVSARRARI